MFLYLIAALLITLSPGFRRLGDWAADTLVVYTANSRAPGLNPAALPAVAVPEGIPVPVMSYEEKQAVLTFARRYPLLAPARADEIAHGYVEYLRGKTAAVALPDSEYLLALARKLSGDSR
jgi:hypothetical protein